MKSRNKHDNDDENNHTQEDPAKESSPNVRRSSRRRVVTNRFINYKEKNDDDIFVPSDDEDTTTMKSSKSTNQKRIKSKRKTKSTAAGSSRKRKIDRDDEESFSEGGEEADDEGGDTPKKSRPSHSSKQKKKKKARLPSKKKKVTTNKKARTSSKDKASIMEDSKPTTNDVSDVEDNISHKDEKDTKQKKSPPSKKRGRPSKKSTAKTKKKRRKASRGPEEQRTCPHCKRVFSIIEGLKYHIEHKVCSRKPPSTSTNKKTCPYCHKQFSNATGFNYHLKHSVCTKLHRSPTTTVGTAVNAETMCHILTPGQQFVTSYGIVQVVQDNRETPKEPSIEERTQRKQKQRNRNNAKSKIAEKIRKRLATVAVTTWTRREYLARLYKTTIPPLSEDDKDGGGGDETPPSSASANNNTMTSQNVWHAYFDKDPAQRPLPKKYRAIPDTSKLIEGANIFACSAPDRIVECILIRDERRKLYTFQDDIKDDGEKEDNKSWVSTNDAKISSSDTENTSDDEAAPHSTTPPQPHCSMRLFLKRRLLVTPYMRYLPVYACRDCGQEFTSRDGLAYHIKCNVCVKKAEARGEQIRNNLAGIQERVERRIKRHDTVQKLKQEHGSDADDDADGDDSDDNNGTQQQEEISNCPMKGSAMYPEVYEALGYSSNKTLTGTTTAALPNNIAATTVAVLSNKVAPTKTTKKKKKSKKSKDPKLPENLGPPLENPNIALKKLKAEFEALENAVKDIPTPVKKVKKKVKKKKKRRKKVVPVIEKAPLRIVDTVVLAEEVDSGRYPSIKRYDGDHTDECIVCKKGGTLLCCDFCSNATHFSCIRTKLVVKEPEPEDDFMCHKCIQYILQRRVRAEKRRLRKTNSALDKDPSPEENKEKAEENEYEVVAKRGLEVKQLIELLEDAENRLVELAGTAETNDIRRQLLI